MSHLLDTNAFIDHLRRGSASKVTARLASAPTGSVHLCSVVLAELVYGALHGAPSYRTANLALVGRLRQQYPSLAFDDRAAEECGRAREHLAACGTPIGPVDLMIASIALANQMTLVTHGCPFEYVCIGSAAEPDVLCDDNVNLRPTPDQAAHDLLIEVLIGQIPEHCSPPGNSTWREVDSAGRTDCVGLPRSPR